MYRLRASKYPHFADDSYENTTGHTAVEQREQCVVGNRQRIGLVIRKVAVGVEGEDGRSLEVPVDDLRSGVSIGEGLLSLLQLKPFLLGRPPLQLLLEWLQPCLCTGVVADLKPVLGNVEQEQVPRLDAPSLGVLAFEERPQQLRRAGVVCHDGVPSRAVDHEGGVQTGHDATQRCSEDFTQGPPPFAELFP